MTEEIDSEVLISLVVNRPVLWDKTLDIFKDRLATRNAWREVCIELNPSFDVMGDKEKNAYGKEVLKRWQNLRDAYAKSKKKIKDNIKSGAASKTIKKYVFNDQLNFLDKLYNSRDTVDSLEGAEEARSENDLSVESAEDGEVHDALVTSVNKPQKRPIAQPRPRKHKRLDEVELKILKSLDPPPPSPKNYKLSFFESLLPHLETFDDSDMLQLKMGVLQVIANITEKKNMTSQHSQMFSQPNNAMFPHNNSPLQPHPKFSNQTTSMPQPSSGQPLYTQHQPLNNYYPQANQNDIYKATPVFQRNAETVQPSFTYMKPAKQLPTQTTLRSSHVIQQPTSNPGTSSLEIALGENYRKQPSSSLSNPELFEPSPVSDSCSNSPYLASPQYSSEDIDFGVQE